MRIRHEVESRLAPIPPGGLAALRGVEISPLQQRLLDQAASRNGGSPAWRRRKLAEARELLALARITARMRVDFIDLEDDLRALIRLEVPVPCRPDSQGALRRADRCLLGLTYPEEGLRGPLPGPSFVQLLSPVDVWHANVSPPPIQRLCLGARMAANVKCKDLILMSFGALSMQTVQLDQLDAAGVMNLTAAQWWQDNTRLLPLTSEPFLARTTEPATG